MDSPVSKTDASKEKFVASRPSTADSKTMRGCGLANLAWVGVDKVELRQRLMMPEYLRLAMRDCIKRKDSSAIPDHLLLPGGAVADMAPHAPMVVFINPNSGGRHGPVLKERLQQLMSEEQVLLSLNLYFKSFSLGFWGNFESNLYLLCVLIMLVWKLS